MVVAAEPNGLCEKTCDVIFFMGIGVDGDFSSQKNMFSTVNVLCSNTD